MLPGSVFDNVCNGSYGDFVIENFCYFLIAKILRCEFSYFNNTAKICIKEYGHYPLNYELGVAA
jgi:hypothetical protein